MSNWQEKLDQAFATKDKQARDDEAGIQITMQQVARFFSDVVLPAFEEARPQLELRGRDVVIYSPPVIGESAEARIVVSFKNQREIDYAIRVRVSPRGATAYTFRRYSDHKTGKSYTSEGSIGGGVQNNGVTALTKENILNSFVEEYTRSIQ